MLIQTELGLSDRHIAEEIKKYPLAKVESLFHMRMENGQMTFVDESIDPRFFGRVVLLTENGLVRIEEEIPDGEDRSGAPRGKAQGLRDERFPGA